MKSAATRTPAERQALNEAARWHTRLHDEAATPEDLQAWQQWHSAHPSHQWAWQTVQAVSQRLARIPAPVAMQALAQPPMARRAALRGVALGLGAVYRPQLHEPGERTVLGRRYADTGLDQARQILHDLSTAPATAHHVSTKIARHFVTDEPPPALVERLTDVWLRSRGDLPTVYQALVEHDASWSPQARKFKTPWEWLVSSGRALGWRQWVDKPPADQLLNQLGQPLWQPGSPAGYDDIAASWAAPDALLRRAEVAQQLAARTRAGVDARRTAALVLPGSLGEATAQAVARAESPAQALALMLVSPEFLRR